ncbi:hypothetical protein WA026_007382 [Henosepilachna vigintioctopunctata]|uniref:Uncharacterized protein n=1 Tax=Henosepilachna vigintioctopunctata TaxID=420089 RepID=A0AAW1UUR8_9CUCU
MTTFLIVFQLKKAGKTHNIIDIYRWSFLSILLKLYRTSYILSTHRTTEIYNLNKTKYRPNRLVYLNKNPIPTQPFIIQFVEKETTEQKCTKYGKFILLYRVCIHSMIHCYCTCNFFSSKFFQCQVKFYGH